jgi:hypothetical protein
MPPAGFKPAIPAGELPQTPALRWAHTCNVTAHRNAVTSQVTDAIRSYGLNFHHVPHGVTVSCEHYTMGFPVCYGSQKHHECKGSKRNVRWWLVTLHVQTCPGRNRLITLMLRPNIDSAPNMLVTLPRNQLWYVTWSRVPFTLLRYGVKVRGKVTNVYSPSGCAATRIGMNYEYITKE